MTDSNRENLSAAVDGELAKEELRFLLRRLDHDASLRQAWSSYQLAGDGLRRRLPPLASAGFAERVFAAVELEAGRQAASAGGRRHWLRWSAGGAIAAGVAVAALMIARPAGDGGERPLAAAGPAAAPAGHPAVASAPAGMPASVPAWLSAGSASQLSQPASATLGDPDENMAQPYARQLAPYQLRHYRAVPNGDGSYLLLLDPDQAPSAAASRASAAN
jgi:sigma-E factor negative regulatory protein RseA